MDDKVFSTIIKNEKDILMNDKVFCSECKYYKWISSGCGKIDVCEHPSNKAISYNYRNYSTYHIDGPSRLNLCNNCKNYCEKYNFIKRLFKKDNKNVTK